MTSAATAPAPPANGAVKWTRPELLFAAIFATFVVLLAGTVLLPHDPYVRFQQLARTIQFRSQWIYERIALDKTPIDVAIVGNSRLGAGFSGPQLQAALRKATGEKLYVANLSMPQEGRNIHYVIAKRLLEHHPEVKLIVLSVTEQMPRSGHPAFRDLADAKDVLTAPRLINPDYADDVAVLPFRQISLFVQSLFPGLFGNAETLDRNAYPGTDFDSSKSFYLPDGRRVERDRIVDPAALAAASRERIANNRPHLLPERFGKYEFAEERFYTDRIAALARASGVSLMFVQLPIYQDKSGVADRAYYEAIGPVIRPGFIDGDYRLYSDYGHLNVYGTRLATAWLASEIGQLERAGRIRQLAPAER